MRIETEIKLDYKDVLLRPKRSVLGSRKEVNLSREFTFRNCKQKWGGVPIVAANMDHVGTVEMAKALSDFNMLTCLHKYITVDDTATTLSSVPSANSAISIGLHDSDLHRLEDLVKEHRFITFICIDVANGYSERFSKYVKKIRILF